MKNSTRTLAAILALVICMSLSFAACSSAPASAPAAAPAAETTTETAAEPQFVFSFATNQPETHPAAKGYLRIADEVFEKSGGRLKIDVYLSSALGDEKEYTDGMVNKTIDMSGTSPVEVSKRYSPLSIFDGPYIFDSPEHMLAVASSPEMDRFWDELAEQYNIRVLGTFFFGNRNLTTKSIAAYTPADMNGAKLRCIDSPISMASGRALGANPVPMAFSELYLGLQQGTVDAQENPVTSILVQKFYEVQKYLVLTKHVTAGNFITISEEKWQALPDDLKQILQDAVDANVKSISEEILALEESGVEELKGYGMEVIEPDLDAFRANAKPIQEEMMDTWGQEIYDLVKSVKAD